MTESVVGAAAVFEHLNGNHADTVLFLARYLAGDDALTDAELVTARVGGVEIDVCGTAGTRRVRVPAPAPIATTSDLHGLLMGCVGDARAADPDGELTSIERELAVRDAIPTRGRGGGGE
ncbi:MAG: DUF2470 domain-containing protein [Acidimicrobiales bacterium]